MTVILHKFGSIWGIADASPFCVKLENFLRINNISFNVGPYDMKSIIGKSPKKKVPFVDLSNGERLGDSQLIIERLSKDLDINMDAPLTTEQKAISHAYRKMLDECFYFYIVYSRWGSEKGWRIIKDEFFSGMPPVIGELIINYLRKGVQRTLFEQGTARHSHEEIMHMAKADLDSISTLLEQNTWFFGSDKPTMLDLVTHAYIINIMRAPVHDEIKEYTLLCKNLCQHAERLQTQLYEDVKEQKLSKHRKDKNNENPM